MIDVLFDYRLTTIIFVVTALFILLRSSGLQPSRQRVFGLLVWLGIFVLFLNYLDISSWSNLQDVAKLHYHDFYHYYFGSKYYPEISHHNLYNCTWQAFDELKQAGVSVPNILEIRALDQSQITYSGSQLLTVGGQCQQVFEPERWQQFKQELGYYVALEHPGYDWNHIFSDLGNNPPPSWNIAPSLLANLIPLNVVTVKLLPLIDLVVFIVLIPLIVRRYYGGEALMWYLCIYLANPLAQWAWNGGSYFRSFWFLTLVWGLGELGRERYGRAGVLLMLSSTLRIFPVMFLAGAALYLIANYRDNKTSMMMLAASSSATLIVIFVLSLGLFGWQHWLDFIEYVISRIDPLNSNAVGLLKVATFYNNTVVPITPTLSSMNDWLSTTSYDYARYYWLTWTAKIALLSSAIYLGIKSRADVAAILIGIVAIFTLLSAFTYYYVFLALLPIALLHHKADKIQLFLIMIVGMLLLRVMSINFQQEIGNDPEYFEVAYHSSYIILCMLAVLLLSVSMQGKTIGAVYGISKLRSCFRYRQDGGTGLSSHEIIQYGMPVVLFLIVFYFRPIVLSNEGFQEFQKYAISSSDESAKLVVKPATNSWYGEDYALIRMSSTSDWVKINLDVRSNVDYDLELYLTVGPGIDDMTIEVAGRVFTHHLNSHPSDPEPRVIKLTGLRFSQNHHMRFRSENVNGPVVLAIDGLRLLPHIR